MELIPSSPEAEALKSLTDLEQYYVKLKAEPPLSILTDGQRKKLCLDIITVSMVEISPNGQTDQKIIQAQTELLFKELSGKYLTLTPSELKEAFKKGIRGESGPYFGMCPKTYAQFIKWWFDNQDRNKAFTKYIDKVNGYERKENPKYHKAKFYEWCENAYAKYKETGIMPYAPFSFYDFIKEYTGAETLMEKEKWPSIKSEAKVLFSKREKVYNSEKKWSDESKKALLDSCIKEVAVKYYFDYLIYLGRDRIVGAYIQSGTTLYAEGRGEF